METRPEVLLAVVARARLDGEWSDGWKLMESEGDVGLGLRLGSMMLEVDGDAEQESRRCWRFCKGQVFCDVRK